MTAFLEASVWIEIWVFRAISHSLLSFSFDDKLDSYFSMEQTISQWKMRSVYLPWILLWCFDLCSWFPSKYLKHLRTVLGWSNPGLWLHLSRRSATPSRFPFQPYSLFSSDWKSIYLCSAINASCSSISVSSSWSNSIEWMLKMIVQLLGKSLSLYKLLPRWVVCNLRSPVRRVSKECRSCSLRLNIAQRILIHSWRRGNSLHRLDFLKGAKPSVSSNISVGRCLSTWISSCFLPDPRSRDQNASLVGQVA